MVKETYEELLIRLEKEKKEDEKKFKELERLVTDFEGNTIVIAFKRKIQHNLNKASLKGYKDPEYSTIEITSFDSNYNGAFVGTGTDMQKPNPIKLIPTGGCLLLHVKPEFYHIHFRKDYIRYLIGEPIHNYRNGAIDYMGQVEIIISQPFPYVYGHFFSPGHPDNVEGIWKAFITDNEKNVPKIIELLKGPEPKTSGTWLKE